MSDWARVLERLEGVLDRVERLLPEVPETPDFAGASAFRWRADRPGPGFLEAVRHPHGIRLEDLRGIDGLKAELDRNTRQFLAGLPANNALLWGPRGTGKSSLVKALLNAYADSGLRLIEVEKHHLVELAEIVRRIEGRPERFVLFCDDLSFEADDPAFKALKVALDGSVGAAPDNAVIYATSNRRHLMPEYMAENREARVADGEIHDGEAADEKVSLSERFGLWLSFQPFDQDTYLDAVRHWLAAHGVTAQGEEAESLEREALQWALTRGSRSGRVAWQFARDRAGRRGLGQD